jgi:opacity protein-like surface antigen
MKKILLTSAAVAVLASSSAYAMQDTFYVKAQAGWSKMSKVKFNGNKLKSNNDMSFGVGAGYHVMDNVRVDLTFDHFVNPTHKVKKKIDTVNESIKAKGDVNSLLINGFVDLFDADMAKMFVGAGVGVSQVKAKTTVSKVDDKTSITLKAKQKYNLAFAAYVGGSYEFTPGVTGELTYSYRDMGKTKKFKDNNNDNISAIHYKGHNIGAGVRFDI